MQHQDFGNRFLRKLHHGVIPPQWDATSLRGVSWSNFEFGPLFQLYPHPPVSSTKWVDNQPHLVNWKGGFKCVMIWLSNKYFDPLAICFVHFLETLWLGEMMGPIYHLLDRKWWMVGTLCRLFLGSLRESLLSLNIYIGTIFMNFQRSFFLGCFFFGR